MIEVLERTCENCEYEHEEELGPHCIHCVCNATDQFKPKEKKLTEQEIRNKAIDEFVEKILEELEEAKEKIANEDYCKSKNYIENGCEHKSCFRCCAEYLIDIVRKGGTNNVN